MRIINPDSQVHISIGFRTANWHAPQEAIPERVDLVTIEDGEAIVTIVDAEQIKV